MPGYISHKISFSDIQVSKPGTIDCEAEGLNAIIFRNQGTADVLVNNIIIKSETERIYAVEDGSDIVCKLNYKFEGAGTNVLVITRAKRVRSVWVEVKTVSC